MTVDLSDLEDQYGLPDGLLSAVQQQESGGNPNAVSPKGAIGTFQFEPDTAKQYGIDPTDPDQAAHGAAMMFSDLSDKYNGDVPSMLAAYNWGQGNVDRKGLENAPAETQNYIKNVQAKLPQGVQYAMADTGNMMDASVDLGGLSDADLDAQIAKLQDSQQIDPSNLSDADLDAQIAKLQGGKPQSLIEALQNPSTRGIYRATMNTVAKPINNAINSVISPAIGAVASIEEKPAQGIANSINSTDAGQWIGDKLLGAKNAVSDVGANIKDLESYSPGGDLTKDLSALDENAQLAGNIAVLKPVSELVGTALSKTGSALSDAGDAQALARKTNFVQDLITPKVTPTVAADQFSRSTEQGLLRNRVVEPTPQEQAITNTVSQLPVSPNKSMLANYNIISDANTKEATDLIAKLKTNNVPIDLGDVQDTISNSVNELRQNPFVTGDGENAALKVVNVMNKAILDNTAEDGTVTASGLLQARKDFDGMIKAQKGGKIFDPVLDSPTSIAVQNMRQSVNNLIESKVPDAGFKASLQKQSNLYRAMDNIETKGASEAPNLLSRTTQKVADLIPGKGLITKGAVLATGATGAAMAPVATGLGLAGYGGYKVATSPLLKQVVGKTLSTAGSALGGTESSRAVVSKFMGTPKIIPDNSASRLGVMVTPSLDTAKEVPFLNGAFTAKFSPTGSAVFDNGKPIASYNYGDQLFVDPAYRRSGIGQELAYQWHIRNPQVQAPIEMTKSSKGLYDKVAARLAKERTPDESGYAKGGIIKKSATTNDFPVKSLGPNARNDIGSKNVHNMSKNAITKNREIHLSKKLEIKLGRKPKTREIELAEYVGAHGVHRLLKQKNVSMPAHKMFPETTVKQKRELFFNKRKPYTVEQIKTALG